MVKKKGMPCCTRYHEAFQKDSKWWGQGTRARPRGGPCYKQREEHQTAPWPRSWPGAVITRAPARCHPVVTQQRRRMVGLHLPSPVPWSGGCPSPEGEAGAGPREVILQDWSGCWVENSLCEVPRGSRRPVDMAAVLHETDSGSRGWDVRRTERRTRIQESYKSPTRVLQNKAMDSGGWNFPLLLWSPSARTLVPFNSTHSQSLCSSSHVCNYHVCWASRYTVCVDSCQQPFPFLLVFLSTLHVSMWDRFPPEWKLPALFPWVQTHSSQVIFSFASLEVSLFHLHSWRILWWVKDSRLVAIFFHRLEEIVQLYCASHGFPSEASCWSCCLKEPSFQHLWLLLSFPFIFGLPKLQWRVQGTVFFVFILLGLTGLILRVGVFQRFLKVSWNSWPLFLLILLLSISSFFSLEL